MRPARGLAQALVPRPERADRGELDQLLTVGQVAELLQLSTRTIRRLAASGRIPCLRIASRTRFVRGDVLRWLAAQRKES
jgi:excisionase family DNA binding protein